MAEKNQQETKPFYKRTWFFVLVGIIVLGGLSSTLDESNDSVSESSEDTISANDSDEQDEEPAAVELEMPDVTGLSGGDASQALQDIGFKELDFSDLSEEQRTVLVTSNWQVCSSSPSPGEQQLSTNEVILYVVKDDENCADPNGSDESKAVPITSVDQLEAELTLFLGENTNRDTPRGLTVSQPLAESEWYRITFEVDDSLFGSVRDVALKDFRDIFPIVERAEFVEEVSFVAKYPLIDNTGQIFIEEVVDLYFATEVYEQIIIENVTSEMFLASATEAYIHPALEE